MSQWRRRRRDKESEGERSVTLAHSLAHGALGAAGNFSPSNREGGRRTMIWSEQGKSKAGMGSIYEQGEHDEPGLHNVATIRPLFSKNTDQIPSDCNVN